MTGRLSIFLFLGILCSSATVCWSQELVPVRVVANGAELHYIEKGSGEQLSVFIRVSMTNSRGCYQVPKG